MHDVKTVDPSVDLTTLLKKKKQPDQLGLLVEAMFSQFSYAGLAGGPSL